MPPAPFTPSMQDSVPLFLEETLVHTDLEPLVYEEWSGVVATDNLKNATNSTMPRIALSFFDGLIDSRLLRSSIYHKFNSASHSLLSLRLARLREGLQSLIVEVVKDPTLSRFVPPHQNTRCNNLILETVSGEISGVVDWEYCGCLPAAMAAQYPGWIRPPIDESLQYRNPKDTFLHYTFELKAPTPIGS
ncbi:uncharacterized protein C8R40DRAFT_1241840 [Lentinula edodes]|uniref:uncharacterized protein n=1 Tax=Lentinula edodes TaxID=5353 RepID=UPI001E8D7F0D|nr:uncharacterized protein C8R40DRAFT_1241840 [Lentinula edodes]KAH7868054.1 hypothetical protein C8R40DRAFT_1241840 [Lentinula edodes]